MWGSRCRHSYLPPIPVDFFEFNELITHIILLYIVPTLWFYFVAVNAYWLESCALSGRLCWTWIQLCNKIYSFHFFFFRIPKIDKGLLKFLDGDDPRLDPSAASTPELYCTFVEGIKKECYTKSILDLWEYDKNIIMNLTKEDIIAAVNSDSE